MCEVYYVFWMTILAGLCPYILAIHGDQSYITVTDLILVPNRSPPFELNSDEVTVLTFNYTFIKRNITLPRTYGWIISARVENTNVADIVGGNQYFINETVPTGNISLTVGGLNAGRSNIRFYVQKWIVPPPQVMTPGPEVGVLYGSREYQTEQYQIYITMKQRPIDIAFNVVLFLLVVTANTGMGTQVDLKIVAAELKHPVASMIGLFSQFCFMPLIAYFVAVSLEVEPGIALGLFVSGCAPGGLASNIFTYLLGGNLSLSITMTLVSTLASLGLIPLWLFTLGKLLYQSADIVIPFQNIIGSLFVIIIPTVIGLSMNVMCPRVAVIMIKITKYVMAVILLCIFTVGVYANWWVLNLVDNKVMLASAALPYLGFILGGFAAFVGRQNVREIVTIAVETGIQNTAIPIVMLRLSLKGPEQATSIVVPIISSTLTPIPLVIAIIYLEIKACIRRKQSTVDATELEKRQQQLTESERTLQSNSAKDGEQLDVAGNEYQTSRASPAITTDAKNSESPLRSLPEKMWKKMVTPSEMPDTTV